MTSPKVIYGIVDLSFLESVLSVTRPIPPPSNPTCQQHPFLPVAIYLSPPLASPYVVISQI